MTAATSASGRLTTNSAPRPTPALYALDRPAVHLDQPARQRQADAEPALRLVGTLDLAEHLEEVGQRLRRDADAVVADADEARPASCPASTSIRPPRGVQLALLLTRFVTTWVRRARSARIQIGSSGTWTRRSCRPAITSGEAASTRGLQDRSQGRPLRPDVELAARDARHVEEVVEQARQVAHLPLDDAAPRAPPARRAVRGR